MALTPEIIDELDEDARKLLDLWMRTKLVFVRSFGTEAISNEQESAYLQLKSEISRIYRIMSDNLTPGLLFDGDVMQEVLKNAMSMAHLRNQNPKERQKFYAQWHRVYIKLTRTLGALEVMKAGYLPNEHRALLTKKANLKVAGF